MDYKNGSVLLYYVWCQLGADQPYMCSSTLQKYYTQNHKHFWGNLYFSNDLETKIGADCNNIGPRFSMLGLMFALLAGALLVDLQYA